MSKIYYYVSNLLAVFNMHNGAIASTVLNEVKNVKGKGVLQTKDNYKHNF